MEQEDLEAQAVEMLIKDILKIEKGTLIKGLTVKPFKFEKDKDSKQININVPRVATLNVNGWEYPVPEFDFPVIRTIFYPEEKKPSYIQPVTPERIKEVGINNCTIQDPWNYWSEYNFIEFKRNNPVGVHMSEFIIGHVNRKRKSYVNFYTKVLLITGEVGYLALETENKRKIEAELI